MTPAELRERLLELEDIPYRNFHIKTCPNAQHVIGVRMPEQRKLAKEIIKHGDYWLFLQEIEPYYYEEKLITGIIIASAPMDLQERIDYVGWFLPMVDNWAICDCFCASFKIKKADQEAYWNFLLDLKNTDAEYVLRFVLVMILDHFILPQYLDQVFKILDEINSDKYYVEMAKAWLIAEMLSKFYDETFDYLHHDQISIFAHNKAIQKARESRRLTDAQKQQLLSIKL